MKIKFEKKENNNYSIRVTNASISNKTIKIEEIQ